MRILMLAQFYPPTMGGEEKLVQDLSIHLVARGHDVAVATLWHRGMPDFTLDQGVRVYRIRGTLQRASSLFIETERRHASPFPDPEVTLGLHRIIAKERPEIVHAHNWLVHSYLPIKGLSKARLMMSLHDYSLICAKKSMMYRNAPCSGPGLKCWGCGANHYGTIKGYTTVLGTKVMGAFERTQVDLFLPVSRAVARLNRLDEGRHPYEVVPNFIPDDLCAIREGYESYLDQLPREDYLLYVGDLRQFKGVNELFAAYSGLQSAPPLVLIGRKTAETPTRLPANVYALGNWPHDAVMEAWRRSLIGLLPSIGQEAFGIVLLEAMAMGRPVIASRIGGIPEVVIDGETGFLVPPGDPVQLRQAIERLLADPSLRARMGEASKRHVMQYQASTVVPRIERIYESVLKRNQEDRFNTTRHKTVNGIG